jgi:hypothetical protein
VISVREIHLVIYKISKQSKYLVTLNIKPGILLELDVLDLLKSAFSVSFWMIKMNE